MCPLAKIFQEFFAFHVPAKQLKGTKNSVTPTNYLLYIFHTSWNQHYLQTTSKCAIIYLAGSMQSEMSSISGRMINNQVYLELSFFDSPSAFLEWQAMYRALQSPLITGKTSLRMHWLPILIQSSPLSKCVSVCMDGWVRKREREREKDGSHLIWR